jgi:hypothetical protein
VYNNIINKFLDLNQKMSFRNILKERNAEDTAQTNEIKIQ